MWIVIRQEKFNGYDRLQPTSAVGPFDDYRAATLWCDRMGMDYSRDGSTRILELAWVHMHSVDGPPILVATYDEAKVRVIAAAEARRHAATEGAIR